MDYGNSNTTGRRLKHFFSPCLLVLLLFSLLSNLANADLTKLDEGKTLFFENKLEEAQHALEISSAQGSPEAFYYLALINRKRNGDELKTLEHLQASAEDTNVS